MAFLVWGLLACSGVYWAIQLLARPLPTPAEALPVSEQGTAHADLTRLFGVSAAVAATVQEPAAAGRFTLLGVVAPKVTARHQQEGVALIAVDGVARTVRIGALVDGDLRLLAVDSRSASLGQGGVVSLSLQLAAPTPASTGALAPAEPSPTILGGNVPPPTPALPGIPGISGGGPQQQQTDGAQMPPARQ